VRPGRHAAADGTFGRSTTGAAARGAGLLAVAVVLGIVLLQAFDNGADPFATSVRAGAPKKKATGGATTTVAPTTTVAVRPPSEVKVLPANGSGVAGAGTRTGTLLKSAGYNVLAATNTIKSVTVSAVEFAPGYQPEAAAIATALSLPPTSVEPIPTPAPVSDTRGANVLVLVGPDLVARLPTPSTTTTVRAATATTVHHTVTSTTIRASATTTTIRHLATTTTTTIRH
jgi:hypothetical protein